VHLAQAARIASTSVSQVDDAPFRHIDPDNRLVTHLRPPHNHRTAWSARGIAMRAKALSIVRVSDRDAGGSEVPTVAGPIHGSECPPAPPSRRWRSNYAIQ